MGHVLLITLLTSLAINLLMFLVAYKWQSDKLTDISYAVSFMAINLIVFTHAGKYNDLSTLLFWAITIWALRIGVFLLMRVLKVGKDKRFDGMRESFFRFGKFWLGQALVAWILMLPIILLNGKIATVSLFPFIGIVIWAIGLTVEAIADNQKYVFKQNKSNRDKWIQSGLWSLARHPNYFGEITCWVGIYVACYQVLTPGQRFAGLLSPLLVYFLLRFGSGVPILERSADKKWGKLNAYKRYKQSTRLLIPLPKLGN